MQRPIQQFPIGTRVRLKDDIDPAFFGGYSRTGQEGWIRKRKRDRYGYPEVLIEWDKDAWSFNGQPDCWTMEGHFEAVEESIMDTPNPNDNRDEKIRDLTEKFMGALFDALGTEETQEAFAQEEISELKDSEQWDALATTAAETVMKAPAYIVIALEQIQVEGTPPMIIPRVFHAARESDYRLITQSHLAHVLASMQDEMIAEILHQQLDDDGKDR